MIKLHIVITYCWLPSTVYLFLDWKMHFIFSIQAATGLHFNQNMNFNKLSNKFQLQIELLFFLTVSSNVVQKI